MTDVWDDDDDVMGDELDELLEGDVEIVGARRRKGRARRRKARRRLQMVFAGLPQTDVAPGAQATLEGNVAEPFRPERLVLVATDATTGAQVFGASLLDIRIGTISQNQNLDPVPVQAFNADAVGVRLRGSTAQPGVGVDVTVVADPAIAPNDTRFRGVLIGPALTP